MIRINRLTDYASLILGLLFETPKDYIPVSLLVTKLHLPKATTSKILKKLVNASFVDSAQGKFGGYKISDKAYSANVFDLIILFEGDISLTTCHISPKLCPIEEFCKVKGSWNTINHLITHHLQSTNLSEFLGARRYQ